MGKEFTLNSEEIRKHFPETQIKRHMDEKKLTYLEAVLYLWFFEKVSITPKELSMDYGRQMYLQFAKSVSNIVEIRTENKSIQVRCERYEKALEEIKDLDAKSVINFSFDVHLIAGRALLDTDIATKALAEGEVREDDEEYDAEWMDANLFNSVCEEQRKRYFLIKWLIELLLKYFNEEYYTIFTGISFKSQGIKNNCEEFPSWLRLCFGSMWIHQYRNGGYTGDDFAGDIYIKLFPFVYLVFNYEC